MVGVDKQTKGGMWTVAENYINSKLFSERTNLKYVATSITGTKCKRILFTAKALLVIIFELLFKKYNLVHIHMAERGSVYRKNIVINISKIFACKVVLHMHGAEFETWYKEQNESKKEFIRSVLDKADKIIILGEYWREFVASLVNDEKKICVVYNAVAVPEKNRYNSDATNLLFLGAVGARKGIYDLLGAMKIAEEQLEPNVKLFVYGPDVENNIEEKIAEYGVQQRVEYKGWLSAEEKEKVFNSIAANILPSYNEGLPMTILETMSYGIPNISTNVAAIPEAINCDNGMIIEPGNKEKLAECIQLIMTEKEKRVNMSNQSHNMAKRLFALEQHILNVLKIYEELEN